MNLLQTTSYLKMSSILAQRIGDRPAIFLHQLNYWLLKGKVVFNEKTWIYNSFSAWQENFPFWSIRTIKRIIKYLVEKKLIEIKQLDANPLNHTNWYTINYDHELLQLEGNETEEKRKRKGLPKSSPFLLPDCAKMSQSGSKNSRPQFNSKINDLKNLRLGQNDPIDQAKMTQSKHITNNTNTNNNIYRSSWNLTGMEFKNIELKKIPLEALDHPLPPTDKKSLYLGACCVLKFLNDETNREYRAVDSNLRPIIARLRSGVTVRDCWKIIRRKQKEWNGTDFAKYLRVSTLFKWKFEEYLAELRGCERQLQDKLLTNEKNLKES